MFARATAFELVIVVGVVAVANTQSDPTNFNHKSQRQKRRVTFLQDPWLEIVQPAMKFAVLRSLEAVSWPWWLHFWAREWLELCLGYVIL